MTDQNVTSGTAPALHVTYDPSTNRQTGECADANGNLNSISGVAPCASGYTYDVQNRILKQSMSLGSISPSVAYAYNTGNKRIWKGTGYTYDPNTLKTTATVEEITFWGAGKKLGTYSLTQTQPGGPDTQPQMVVTPTGTDYYFGGKLIKNSTGYVTPDRLGSIGKYFPYGQQRPSATTDGKEKFATYFRDSETALDYADQRYEQPGMGRFMSPDPYKASAGASDPGSWNRYAYVGGDPINMLDPNGLDEITVTDFYETLAYITLPSLSAFGSSGGSSYYIGIGQAIADQVMQQYQVNQRVAIAKAALADAVDRVTDELSSEACGGLFLKPDENTREARVALWHTFLDVNNSGLIRIVSAASQISGVPATTTTVGDQRVIYIAADSTFVTGSAPNPAYDGLSLNAKQDLILIHEFLHWMGVIGADDQDQSNLFPDGSQVTGGSIGVTSKVRQKCF